MGLLHEIPPIITNGLFTIGAAMISGMLAWRNGDKSGQEKVHANYVAAIQSASADVIAELRTVITEAKAHEAECIGKLNAVEAQISELMRDPVKIYRPGSTASME